MSKVYIGMVDITSDFQMEDAWQTSRVEKVFNNEVSAKEWIDDVRYAHRTGNDGNCNQEDTYERWSKGEAYVRFYTEFGRPYKVEYYYIEMEVES